MKKLQRKHVKVQNGPLFDARQRISVCSYRLAKYVAQQYFTFFTLLYLIADTFLQTAKQHNDKISIRCSSTNETRDEVQSKKPKIVER
jgi:hypothetical protein